MLNTLYYINGCPGARAVRLFCRHKKLQVEEILVDFKNQTKSKRAAYIIENFDQELSKFIHVVPDEVIDKLNFPVTEKYKIA